MKTLYLISAMVLLLACNRNQESPEEHTTTSHFTIAPSGEKELREIVLPPIAPIEIVAQKKEPEPLSLLAYRTLLNQLTPQQETFTVSVYSDTIIHCSKGTRIKIDAGSFVTADWGQPVTGEVEIKVREFYDLPDMLLAGLSTTSGNQLLETGGMIHISAYARGEKCRLGKDKTLQIGFPVNGSGAPLPGSQTIAPRKTGMQLFSGTVDRRGQFNWTLATGKKKAIEFEYKKPEFPGGDTNLVAYLEKTFEHPDLSRLRNQLSRVFVSFIIDENGEVVETRVLNGISPGIDQEVVNMICNMPAWSPAIENGKQVSARIELPVYFGLDPGRRTTPYRIFDCNYISPVALGDRKEVEVEYYYLETSGLGWLNCDRFLNLNSNTQLAVNSKNGLGTQMQLVFHRVQAIVSGKEVNGVFYFQNLPPGEKVSLIAFGQRDDKPYMVIKEITTGVKIQNVIFDKPLSREKLAQEMARIEKSLMAWN